MSIQKKVLVIFALSAVLLSPAMQAFAFTNGEAATKVIGHTTFTTSTPSTTVATINNPNSIALDAAGNLWVADLNNNRVLMYPNGTGFTNGEAATKVIGQSTFTTGTSGTTATTLIAPTGIALDAAGSLWVADAVNNRILGFSDITQTTGQVTVVAPTCGLQILSGSPINYDSLSPGATSTEQVLVLHNTGTTSETAFVNGGNWLDGGSINQMNVGNTKFSITSGTFASKTVLATTDHSLGTIIQSSNLSTYWQLQTNLLSPTFLGSLTQTMTFTTTC